VTIQAWQNLRIGKENKTFSWRASLFALCRTILIFSLYEFMKQVNLIDTINNVSLYFRFTVQKGLANHISVICFNLEVKSLLMKHNFTYISSGSFSFAQKMNAFCLFEKIFIQTALIELIKGNLF
jgi:hypothetical protein